MKRLPAGRKIEPDESVQWFGREIELARRAYRNTLENELIEEENMSHSLLLGRLFIFSETLVTVCNESKSRKEVIAHAAFIANICRIIAHHEKPEEGQEDERETS